MKELFENELKTGDKVSYNGLGSKREGIILKKTKGRYQRSITIKLEFSTVTVKYVPYVPASYLGIELLESKSN